jgi:hypothetical protein
LALGGGKRKGEEMKGPGETSALLLGKLEDQATSVQVDPSLELHHHHERKVTRLEMWTGPTLFILFFLKF